MTRVAVNGLGRIKVLGWYDNEWGYSCRLVDLVERVGSARGARAATREGAVR